MKGKFFLLLNSFLYCAFLMLSSTMISVYVQLNFNHDMSNILFFFSGMMYHEYIKGIKSSW